MFESEILLHFVTQNFERYILRPRWAIPVFVALAGAYLGISDANFRAMQNNRLLQFWDPLLGLFGSPFFIMLMFFPGWIFLTSDLTVRTDNERLVIPRIGKRWRWLLMKIQLLAICTAIYIGIVALGVLLITATFFASVDISRVSGAMTTDVLGADQIYPNPLLAITIGLFLLTLGAFTIGLIVQAVVLLTNSALCGFMAGFGLILASFGTMSTPNLVLVRLLTLNYLMMYTNRTLLELVGSLLYWFVLLSGTLLTIRFVLKQVEF